jgi:hypothetical protein
LSAEDSQMNADLHVNGVYLEAHHKGGPANHMRASARENGVIDVHDKHSSGRDAPTRQRGHAHSPNRQTTSTSPERGSPVRWRDRSPPPLRTHVSSQLEEDEGENEVTPGKTHVSSQSKMDVTGIYSMLGGQNGQHDHMREAHHPSNLDDQLNHESRSTQQTQPPSQPPSSSTISVPQTRSSAGGTLSFSASLHMHAHMAATHDTDGSFTRTSTISSSHSSEDFVPYDENAPVAGSMVSLVISQTLAMRGMWTQALAYAQRAAEWDQDTRGIWHTEFQRIYCAASVALSSREHLASHAGRHTVEHVRSVYARSMEEAESKQLVLFSVKIACDWLRFEIFLREKCVKTKQKAEGTRVDVNNGLVVSNVRENSDELKAVNEQRGDEHTKEHSSSVVSKCDKSKHEDEDSDSDSGDSACEDDTNHEAVARKRVVEVVGKLRNTGDTIILAYAHRLSRGEPAPTPASRSAQTPDVLKRRTLPHVVSTNGNGCKDSGMLSRRESAVDEKMGAAAAVGLPGTPSHNNVPGTPSHNNVPGTPSHNNVPGTPSHNNVPGTPSHNNVPGTPSHNNVPGTPSHNHVNKSTALCDDSKATNGCVRTPSSNRKQENHKDKGSAGQEQYIAFHGDVLGAALQSLMSHNCSTAPEMSFSRRGRSVSIGGETAMRSADVSMLHMSDMHVNDIGGRDRVLRHALPGDDAGRARDTYKLHLMQMDSSLREVFERLAVTRLLREGTFGCQLDVFALKNATDGRPLEVVAFKTLIDDRLMQDFALDAKRLCKFLTSIALHGRQQPFYNAMHSTLAVQCLHWLITRGGLGAALQPTDRLALVLCAVILQCDKGADDSHTSTTTSKSNVASSNGATHGQTTVPKHSEDPKNGMHVHGDSAGTDGRMQIFGALMATKDCNFMHAMPEHRRNAVVTRMAMLMQFLSQVGLFRAMPPRLAGTNADAQACDVKWYVHTCFLPECVCKYSYVCASHFFYADLSLCS